MSGKNNSEEEKYVDERCNRVQKLLNEYTNSIGIPELDVLPDNNKTKQYMAMTRDKIKSLSAEDCGEISYMLSQSAFHIQKMLNIEMSRLNWADSSINKTIAFKVTGYKGYSYEERKNQAIKDDSFASSLFELKIGAQGRVDRLNFLASQIRSMVSTLLELQKSKRGSS